MNKNIFNKINLQNKRIFSFLIFFFVFILTYINNYSFYNYVKVRDYQEIRTLGKSIHYQINNCINNNYSKEDCINNIFSYLNFLKPYGIVEISTMKYNNTKERHKNREFIFIPKYLQNIKSINERLIIKKHSMPNIFFTTFRSMSFSIIDIVTISYKNGFRSMLKWYMKDKIYLRSKNVLAYIFLIIILLKLLQLKQRQYNYEILKQDTNIVNLINNLENTKNKNEELSNSISQLQSSNLNLLEKIKEYDSIINPPIDTLKYDDLLTLDPESIIFKCRKVIEKLITIEYNTHIGESDYKNLDTMIKALRKNNLLSKKAFSYANTIKAFGNISAHPDIKYPIKFTKADAEIISNALILFIEELKNKD